MVMVVVLLIYLLYPIRVLYLRRLLGEIIIPNKVYELILISPPIKGSLY